MLDCPEQIQTSPKSTSRIVASAGPETVRVWGPPAGNGPSLTAHRPSAPAVASADLPAIVTVTRRPGSAQPQTGAGASRCKTM